MRRISFTAAARRSNTSRGVSESSFQFQTAGDQVDVALALANLRIVNAVHLVGQRQKRFREELQFVDVH
jgi:hypothetical protein